MLAVPILTGSAAYALSEPLGWRRGLNHRPERAIEFYGVIARSTLVGMQLNFMGFNPIDALFWTAVVNGFVAPPLLVVIVLITNNAAIMGDRTNGPILNMLGLVTTVAMTAAAVALLITWGH